LQIPSVSLAQGWQVIKPAQGWQVIKIENKRLFIVYSQFFAASFFRALSVVDFGQLARESYSRTLQAAYSFVRYAISWTTQQYPGFGFQMSPLFLRV
jgi:hypothetical protein